MTEELEHEATTMLNVLPTHKPLYRLSLGTEVVSRSQTLTRKTGFRVRVWLRETRTEVNYYCSVHFVRVPGSLNSFAS